VFPPYPSPRAADRSPGDRLWRPLSLGGALEYQRATGPRLSSLDTLIDQEHEHLRTAVARIAALSPDVLLVERTVARFAQELLLEKGVSLVLHVKPAVLARVARQGWDPVLPWPGLSS
jgi:1-phosphatidylinositol-3-phosphate 5-kinase